MKLWFYENETKSMKLYETHNPSGHDSFTHHTTSVDELYHDTHGKT